MNPFFAIVIALVVLAVLAVVWDVRTDGYRAHPVDPELRQRLLDREEARRAAVGDARAAAAAARTAPVPPELAAWRDAPHVATRRPRVRPQRVRH